MKNIKKYLIAVITLISIGALVGCGQTRAQATDSSKPTVVKLGVNGSDNRIWDSVAKTLKKENIDLQIISFTDYNQPNTALSDGEIDINAFQHQYFLSNWNKAHKTNIVAIGLTELAPIGLYSSKIKKIAALKEGDEISIPNDATNEGRALNLLKTLKLIKLDDTALPTPKNITENKLNLKITPLDASQTARSLGDVKAAVINNGVALDAGLNPNKAVALEPVSKASAPYINIIATTKKDANNSVYKKVVAAYQTKANAKLILKTYKGSSIPAWNLKLK